MTPEIKEYKTWEEAALWLARHGWGTNLIEQQKILWEEAQKSVAKPAVTPAPAKSAAATR